MGCRRKRLQCLFTAYFSFALVILFFSPMVFAGEKDTHYFLTYFLARQMGFDPQEAHIIASANWAMDMNSTTVAEVAGALVGQVSNQQNWHCLPPENDPGQRDRRKDELRSRAVRIYQTDQEKVDRLIRLGQYFHFLQDCFFHYGSFSGVGHGIHTADGYDNDSWANNLINPLEEDEFTLKKGITLNEVTGRKDPRLAVAATIAELGQFREAVLGRFPAKNPLGNLEFRTKLYDFAKKLSDNGIESITSDDAKHILEELNITKILNTIEHISDAAWNRIIPKSLKTPKIPGPRLTCTNKKAKLQFRPVIGTITVKTKHLNPQNKERTEILNSEKDALEKVLNEPIPKRIGFTYNAQGDPTSINNKPIPLDLLEKLKNEAERERLAASDPPADIVIFDEKVETMFPELTISFKVANTSDLEFTPSFNLISGIVEFHGGAWAEGSPINDSTIDPLSPGEIRSFTHSLGLPISSVLSGELIGIFAVHPFEEVDVSNNVAFIALDFLGDGFLQKSALPIDLEEFMDIHFADLKISPSSLVARVLLYNSPPIIPPPGISSLVWRFVIDLDGDPATGLKGDKIPISIFPGLGVDLIVEANQTGPTIVSSASLWNDTVQTFAPILNPAVSSPEPSMITLEIPLSSLPNQSTSPKWAALTIKQTDGTDFPIDIFSDEKCIPVGMPQAPGFDPLGASYDLINSSGGGFPGRPGSSYVYIPPAALTQPAMIGMTCAISDQKAALPDDPTLYEKGFVLSRFACNLSVIPPSSGLPFASPVTISFNYADKDISGLDEDTLTIVFHDGYRYRTDGITIIERDPEFNIMTFTTTHFTTFALVGKPKRPTMATLNSFHAISANEKVLISWTTGSEIDNEGFNILRSSSPNGPFVKINPATILTRAISPGGATYSFTDMNVENGKTYYYQLEDIDTLGSKTAHNIVSAIAKFAGATPIPDTSTTSPTPASDISNTTSQGFSQRQATSSVTESSFLVTSQDFAFQMLDGSDNALAMARQESTKLEEGTKDKSAASSLISYKAMCADSHITLEWTSSDPRDRFNIWRSESEEGEYVQINDSALSAPAEKSERLSYTYSDTTVVKGNTYYYKLERLTPEGKGIFIGPIAAMPEAVFDQAKAEQEQEPVIKNSDTASMETK